MSSSASSIAVAHAPGRPLSVARFSVTDLAGFVTLLLAGLSAAAGGIHGSAMPEHAREYWLYGVFFAGSAVFQIGWAFLALRKLTPRLLLMSAAANAAFLLVWFMTRTVGSPVGPEAWMPEPVGFVDAVTVIFEALLVFAGIRLANSETLASLEGKTTPKPLYLLAGGATVAAIWALAAARTHASEVSPGESHARPLLLGAATLSLIYAGSLLRKAPARPEI